MSDSDIEQRRREFFSSGYFEWQKPQHDHQGAWEKYSYSQERWWGTFPKDLAPVEDLYGQYPWAIGPFEKHAANPILSPTPGTWDRGHFGGGVHNGSILVKDGLFYYVYRGEQPIDISLKSECDYICDIGVATSVDGINFQKRDDVNPFFRKGDDRKYSFKDVIMIRLTKRAFSSRTSLAAAILSLLMGSGLQAADKVEVYLDSKQVLAKQFMGFGVQWEYEGSAPLLNIENPLWMSRWSEMERRIDYMRPSVLRVIHDARNYTDLKAGKCVLNFDKKNMTTVYKILDYAQSRQIPVVFGEWWLEANIRKALEGYESPRWQKEAFIPLLNHLRNQRKYGVIRYLNLINEPPGCIGLNEPATAKYMDFPTWKRVILNLDGALKESRLNKMYKIVGTDGPGDFGDWIRLAAGDPELNQAIGAYEYHVYAHPKTSMWVAGLDDGRLEQEELGNRRRIVNDLDPNGRTKPFFMGEAGIDGRVDLADNQPERYHFEYGLRMADFAVQSMRAGQAGLIAWDMDDAMHQWGSYGSLGLKGWGLWNSLAGYKGYPESDFEIRPWYYAWSLMCRYFPRGAQTFDSGILVDSSLRTLRVAACKLPRDQGYSIAIVNRADKPFEVMLKSHQKLALGKLSEFRYQEGSLKLNARGELEPAAIHPSANLESGCPITCPAKSFVVLTSLEYTN